MGWPQTVNIPHNQFTRISEELSKNKTNNKQQQKQKPATKYNNNNNKPPHTLPRIIGRTNCWAKNPT